MSDIQRYSCVQCGDTYWTGDDHACPYDVMPMVLCRDEWELIIGVLRHRASRVGACGGDMQMRVCSWNNLAEAIERSLGDINATIDGVREWIEKQ